VKKHIFISAFFIIFTSFMSLNAQWARTYGESESDAAIFIHQTRDGSYIFTGSTRSFGAGDFDISVIKLDSSGVIEWQRTYGGSDYDSGRSIHQTSDGGYIVTGQTQSFGAGNHDLLVLKLSSTGQIEWQKTFGGPEREDFYFIHQTNDEGYVVAGSTKSYGAGDYDFWVFKLSSIGEIEWQKTFGGINVDFLYSIHQSTDEGYIIAGYTNSFSAGDSDIWVLKLDPIGEIEWQKTFGGSEDDYARSIQNTSDGGYIVAGFTQSFGAGLEDFWILKLNSVGIIEWQRTYGGSEDDNPHFIQQTNEGGYIVSGITYSFGGGSFDFWVLKLSSDGVIEWQQTYGGSNTEYLNTFQKTSDEGYIVGGHTSSFSVGANDALILKLYSDGSIGPSCDLIGSSNAVITDSAISPTNTSITPQDTYVTPLDTSVISQNTDTIVNLLCEALKYALTISANPGGTTDPSPDTYEYYEDLEVQIEAIPNDDYRFSEWTGDVPEGHEYDNPITITMDSNKSIEANFIRQYTLTIAAGTEGTTDPSPGSHEYDSGTQVTVTATANTGYQFSGWSGDVSGTSNPITVTMDSDKSITANFTQIPIDGDGDGDNGGGGGCFIASAAYGSPLHPHVDILRDFRDKYLMTNKIGRSLVEQYYKHSPFFAELIAKHRVLRAAVRFTLMPVVTISYSIIYLGPLFTMNVLILILALPYYVFWRRKKFKNS
jgi:uncharacterized repeat protein (TIGR02543 family)/uncharacterized delta-60 repeat protein